MADWSGFARFRGWERFASGVSEGLWQPGRGCRRWDDDYASSHGHGVLVVYIGILRFSLLSQSLGVTILAILLLEVGPSAYLRAAVLFEPSGRHAFEPVAVWNGAAVAVLTAQARAAVAAIAATVVVQTRKVDSV